MKLGLFLLLSSSLWGQASNNPPQQFGAIKDFLSLTDSQYQTLLSNNSQFNDTANQVQQKVRQLQAEIQTETTRPQPDPLELGIRYVQIAQICGGLADQSNTTVKLNAAMLTEAQKASLKTLEDAVALAPIINDGVNANLLATTSPNGGFYNLYSPGGCSPTFTAVLRTWDFSSPYPQIKNFLVLTDAQYQTIIKNNSKYQGVISNDQSHIYQLQSEISKETSLPPPIPSPSAPATWTSNIAAATSPSKPPPRAKATPISSKTRKRQC